MKLKPLAIGQAGEYLVCSDLILRGYQAHLTAPGSPYDIVLDTGDQLLRVQVKTTCCRSSRPDGRKGRERYRFEMRRRHGKRRVEYDEVGLDLVALVALDIKRVGYTRKLVQTASVYLTKNTGPGLDGVTFDDLTLESVL